MVAKAETKPEVTRPEVTRAELPPQPANHGSGHGVLGVLPASSVAAPPSQALAYADPAPRPQPAQQNVAIKPAAAAAAHTGWIIQVGALESESEARARIELARNQARGLLGKANSLPSRSLPRTIASCSAPASPASSGIRPKRSAGR